MTPGMVGNIRRGICAGAIMMLVQGCTIEQSLQNIEIEGPPGLPPVRITADSTADRIHISPHLVVYGQKTATGRVDGHSKVNADGVYQVDTIATPAGPTYSETHGANIYEYKGRNAAWRLPTLTFGTDFEYTVSKRFALVASFEYTRQHEQDLVGGSVGIALRGWNGQFGTHIEAGVRFDQTLLSTNQAITVSDLMSDVRTVYFYNTAERMNSVDFYAAMTFATTRASWPVNGFLSLGYCTQSLESKPLTGEVAVGASEVTIPDNDAAADILSVAPGLWFSLDPDVRLLAGIRFLWITNWYNRSPESLVIPFVGVDVTL